MNTVKIEVIVKYFFKMNFLKCDVSNALNGIEDDILFEDSETLDSIDDLDELICLLPTGG